MDTRLVDNRDHRYTDLVKENRKRLEILIDNFGMEIIYEFKTDFGHLLVSEFTQIKHDIQPKVVTFKGNLSHQDLDSKPGTAKETSPFTLVLEDSGYMFKIELQVKINNEQKDFVRYLPKDLESAKRLGQQFQIIQALNAASQIKNINLKEK